MPHRTWLIVLLVVLGCCLPGVAGAQNGPAPPPLVLAPRPDAQRLYRSGRRMVIAGSVLLGLSGAALITTGVFAGLAANANQGPSCTGFGGIGCAAGAAAAAGIAVVSGIFFVAEAGAGIPLVVVGASRMRRARLSGFVSPAPGWNGALVHVGFSF